MSEADQPQVQQASAVLPSPPLAVLEEYKIIGDRLANLTDRRQRTNEVYIGVNALFLTGVGLLVVSSHFTSWVPAIEIGAITAVILPLNWAWVRAINFYTKFVDIHYQCLDTIESRFQFVTNLSLKLSNHSRSHVGRAKAVAYYFLLLYAVVAVAVTILTYLTLSRAILQ
jgi:hypothetical protein